MSDHVVKSHNGLKLYSGPLGITISGNTDIFSHPEHVKSYPCKATPIVSSVKRASVVRTLTDKEILQFFKEESIGAECTPKCGNCECGRCPLGMKPMSLKDEKEYKRFRDNMFLDVDGTTEDLGPYWRTSYP